MSVFLKFLLRFVIYLASRHRNLGLRDWLAALIGTVVLAGGLICLVAIQLLKAPIGLEAWISFLLATMVVVYIALMPVLFIIKLRRNGITDADYSIEGGLDYKTALRAGRGGFSLAQFALSSDGLTW